MPKQQPKGPPTKKTSNSEKLRTEEYSKIVDLDASGERIEKLDADAQLRPHNNSNHFLIFFRLFMAASFLSIIMLYCFITGGYATNVTMVIRKLPIDLYPDALCNDGSAGAYYYRKSPSGTSSLVILHQQVPVVGWFC
jgi:hypothetical protein